MKTFLAAAMLITLSTSAIAGTCKGNFADIVGPKVDASAKLTAKCVLNLDRSSITVFEYSDAARNEKGASIIDVGSSSAVSDSIIRVTSPDASWKDALLDRLTDADAYGMSREEATAELKKARCKSL